MVKNKKFSSMSMAIGAALLFGVSAPLAKALLGSIQPTPLASLLYLGCGLGVLIFKLLKQLFIKDKNTETGISKRDLPWLAGVILTGGVAAPIVLMFSLKATPASTASLLLNFEAVSTALIAALFFKESLGKRVWISIAIITVAAIILTWDNTGEWELSLGAVGIICACLLWGADNNMTRMVSLKDPLITTIVKGFGAGTVTLIISLLTAAEHSPQLNLFS
jgi:drug/metabolite transporter (DMT)-like permease